jgi:hypothetical protein
MRRPRIIHRGHCPPGLEPKATFWGQPQATEGEPQAAFWGQPQATEGEPQAAFWGQQDSPDPKGGTGIS